MSSADTIFCTTFVDAAVETTVSSPDSISPGITVAGCVKDMLSDADFYELQSVSDALPSALCGALQRLLDSLFRSLKKVNKSTWNAASHTAEKLQKGEAVALDLELHAGGDQASSHVLDAKRREFERICSLLRCLPHQFLTQQHAHALHDKLQQYCVHVVGFQLHRAGCDAACEQICCTIQATMQALTRVLHSTVAGDSALSAERADVQWVHALLRTAAAALASFVVKRPDGEQHFMAAVSSAAVWVSQLIAVAGPDIAAPIFNDLMSDEITGETGAAQDGETSPRFWLAMCRACFGHYVLGTLSTCKKAPSLAILRALQEHATRALASLVESGFEGGDHSRLSEHLCGMLAATTSLRPSDSNSEARIDTIVGVSCRLIGCGAGKQAARCLCASLRVLHTCGRLTSRVCKDALRAMMSALQRSQRNSSGAGNAAVLDAAVALSELASSRTRTDMVITVLASVEDALAARMASVAPLQLLGAILSAHSRLQDAENCDGENYGDHCAAVAIRAVDIIAHSDACPDDFLEQAVASVRVQRVRPGIVHRLISRECIST